MDEYLGYRKVEFSDDELAQIYSESKVDGYEFLENEYVVAVDNEGAVIDKFCWQNGELRNVPYPIIKNQYLGEVKPRNLEQELFMDMLLNKRPRVKLVQGVYGSGKDYGMFSAALELLERGKFDRIIYVRPNVTVADVPDIGYLSGDAKAKLEWTLAPLYDKVGGKDGIDRLIATGQLESVPLIFIRGRSFEKSIVYVSEGQNMTTNVAKLLLGRVGEGSEIWINGDSRQTDKKIYAADNGITTMIEKLKGNSLFSYIYLPKSERSAVAELANLLD